MAVEKGAKRAALAHVHSQTEALARTESGMSYAKKSVRPNLTALPKRKADFIEPMDCAPVTKLPDGPGWVFEIKFDGYRAIAVKADGRVSLFSRRRKSFDHHYPLIVEALGELPEGTVVEVNRRRLPATRPTASKLTRYRWLSRNWLHQKLFGMACSQSGTSPELPRRRHAAWSRCYYLD